MGSLTGAVALTKNHSVKNFRNKVMILGHPGSNAGMNDRRKQKKTKILSLYAGTSEYMLDTRLNF